MQLDYILYIAGRWRNISNNKYVIAQTVQYSTVQYITVQYITLKYSTVQHSTV